MRKKSKKESHRFVSAAGKKCHTFFFFKKSCLTGFVVAQEKFLTGPDQMFSEQLPRDTSKPASPCWMATAISAVHPG